VDHARFDRIARSLANPLNRRTGLLAALALAAGIGEVRARAGSPRPVQGADGQHAGSGPDRERTPGVAARRDHGRSSAAPDAARRRRRRCKPACGAGFRCERGTCVCASGVACGAACCSAGEACVSGACAAPTPSPVCLEPGSACKDVGIPCCAGLACGSGQGGGAPVCCQVDGPRTCASTAECCYGWECVAGTCTVVIPPTPTPTPRWRYAACPLPEQGVGGQCVVGATCCEGGGCCPSETPVCCRNAEGGGCCPAGYGCFRHGNHHGFCCPPGMGGNQNGTCQ